MYAPPAYLTEVIKDLIWIIHKVSRVNDSTAESVVSATFSGERDQLDGCGVRTLNTRQVNEDDLLFQRLDEELQQDWRWWVDCGNFFFVSVWLTSLRRYPPQVQSGATAILAPAERWFKVWYLLDKGRYLPVTQCQGVKPCGNLSPRSSLNFLVHCFLF